MPKRWCSDCKRLYDIDSAPGLRCPACQAKATTARNARTSAASRGYGAQHRQVRARLLAAFQPGQRCAICGRAMITKQNLDLAHNETRTGWKGLAHRECNRNTGNTGRNATR